MFLAVGAAGLSRGAGESLMRGDFAAFERCVHIRRGLLSALSKVVQPGNTPPSGEY